MKKASIMLKLVSFVLSVLLTFSVIFASYAVDNTVKFKMGDAKANVSKEVTIPLTIENNSGIASFRFWIDYDVTAFKLLSIDAVGKYKNGFLYTDLDKELTGTAAVLWYTTGNVTDNGTVLNLRFRINDTVPLDTYELKLRYKTDDISDDKLVTVPIYTVNGYITVTDIKSTVLYGDADRNGDVNMRDVILIRRYLAGLVGEGDIDLVASAVMDGSNLSMRDVLTVRKYAVGDITSFPVEN